jgi:hypothetical protein
MNRKWQNKWKKRKGKPVVGNQGATEEEPRDLLKEDGEVEGMSLLAFPRKDKKNQGCKAIRRHLREKKGKRK